MTYTSPRRSRRTVSKCILASLSSLAGVSSALAAGGEWTNSTGVLNAWSEAANWSTGAPPTSADPASFSLANTYQVLIDSPAVAYRSTVSAGAVTFDLNAQSVSIANQFVVTGADTAMTLGGGGTFGSPNLFIGGGGSTVRATVKGGGTTLASSVMFAVGSSVANGVSADGTFELLDGAKAANTGEAYIGRLGGKGNVVIDGAGSVLTATTLAVGHSRGSAGPSQGTLTLTRGGQAIASDPILIGAYNGGTGSVTVDGGGSKLQHFDSGVPTFGIMVGFNTSADGSLTISNGGVASTNGQVFVGGYGASGRLYVTGEGSQLVGAGPALAVGSRYYMGGTPGGAMTVSAGGQVTGFTVVNIGTFGVAGEAVIEGARSKLATTTLHVGRQVEVVGGVTLAGNGTLLAQSGATIQSQTVDIGSAGGVGTAVIDGVGTTWTNTGSMAVGHDSNNSANGNGTGSLTVRNGAVVKVGVGSGDILRIAAGGSLTIDSGASLSAPNIEVIGAFNFLGGKVTLNGGTLSAPGLLSVSSGGTLAGTGVISSGGGIHVAGTLSPGASAGALTLGPTSFVAGSTLQLELGGTAAGESDSLTVNGNLDLGGTTLSLSLLDGFDADIGRSFLILQNDGEDTTQGIFGNQLTSADGFPYIAYAGHQFRIDYAANDGNDISMTVVPEPTGAVWLSLATLATLRRRRRHLATQNWPGSGIA